VPMVREIRDYARLGVGGDGRFRVTDQEGSIGDKSPTQEVVPRDGPSRPGAADLVAVAAPTGFVRAVAFGRKKSRVWNKEGRLRW
jgi:hypothetical protein